jgi:hypothetical protein
MRLQQQPMNMDMNGLLKKTAPIGIAYKEAVASGISINPELIQTTKSFN